MMIVLEIFQAPSGEWCGRVTQDGEEIDACAGCSSPEEVEDRTIQAGIDPDQILRRWKTSPRKISRQDPASES
jgi:hypothetical protein